uniref:Uncharacterized protein n=1 Tax=Romanomermis culicivorax TaxID=13658 RepID=A0A915HM50_ROMCU
MPVCLALECETENHTNFKTLSFCECSSENYVACLFEMEMRGLLMFKSKKSGGDNPATTVQSMDAANDFELIHDNEKKEADADKETNDQKAKCEKIMQKMKEDIRPLKE